MEAVKAKQRAREGGDDADMPEAERQQKKELAAIRKAEDDLAEKRALLDGRRKLSAAVSRARLDLQDAQRKLEAAEVELRSTERRVMVVAAALENERFEKKQVRRRVVVLLPQHSAIEVGQWPTVTKGVKLTWRWCARGGVRRRRRLACVWSRLVPRRWRRS